MYQGAQHSSHLLPKVGGFLLLPAFARIVTRLVATAGEGLSPKTNPAHIAAGAGLLAYGAAAFACFKLSESENLSVSMQSLFRGGMWGSGIGAALCAASPVVSSSTPVISGPGATIDKVFNLLTAKAAGAVAQKRMNARKVLARR